MDIDIDFLGRDFKIQEKGHLLAVGYQTLVSRLHCLCEIGVAHVAAVDKEELLRVLAARGRRHAHEAADIYKRRLDFNGYELCFQAFAEHAEYALLEIACGEVHHRRATAMERKGGFGMRQGDAFKFREDIGKFRLVGLQELAAGGNVEKEIFYSKIRPDGTIHRLLIHHAATFDDDAYAEVLVGCTGTQFHLRHSGDRGQCFAAETHSAERKEIFGFGNFRGGVALESKARVGFAHSLAVVNHLHEAFPSVLHDDLHLRGTGIDGVFHQFLNHRRGPLHHFAGRYLVGHGVGQEMYDVAHGVFLFLFLSV